MSVGSGVMFPQGSVPVTPSSGLSTPYFDYVDGGLKFLGSDGLIKRVNSNKLNSILAPAGPFTTGSMPTLTLITGGISSLYFSPGELTLGSVVRVNFIGTCTSSASNQVILAMYLGPLGTHSEGNTAGTQFNNTATSGSSIPFSIEVLLTVSSIGVSGALSGKGMVCNQGVTGISTSLNSFYIMGISGVNTLIGNYLNWGLYTSNATTSVTIQTCTQELIKQ